jgi:hypothetical protein
LATHVVSSKAFDILCRDPFTPADFEEFIVERRRTIIEAIEDQLIKERFDLPPKLRELDADVEKVELALRRAVYNALDGDASLLPSHVSQKLNDRIQGALKKNPALNGQLTGLNRQLEYCDLRKIQDIITAKSTWTTVKP